MSLWTVERLGRRGDGVAHGPDGARALAALTLPGEVIEGEASGIDPDGTDAGGMDARGTTSLPSGGTPRLAAPRIVTPSPDRVAAPCRHFRVCGGCALMHGRDEFVAGWKAGVVVRALAAQSIAAEVERVQTSPPLSRRRAVLAGRRTRKGALVGLHARASEVIVDLTDCLVLRPAITAALPLLRRMTSIGASRGGGLDITVTDGPEGLDVAVAGGRPGDGALLAGLAALAAEGDFARLDWGGEALTRRPPWQAMGRARVVPPPGAFLQATAEGQAALAAAVLEAIPPGAGRVADLFAGCGTFTLPLAERVEVHAVEGLAAPLAALDSAWRATPNLRRVTTEVRDLARRPLSAADLTSFDVIVIDPPRTGAAAQARAIADSQVPVVAWISCDPVSFARDAAVLVAGGYRLQRLQVVDQFRWSFHVETTAVFRRPSPRGI